MLSRRETSRAINGIFREEVLILGALLAVHQVPGAFVTQFLESLEQVRQRANRRIRLQDGEGRPGAVPKPPRLDRDPEIRRFLERLEGTPPAGARRNATHGAQGPEDA